MNRFPRGKVFKGHRIPYGTLANASYELRQAYYTYGWLDDNDMPPLPTVPFEFEEHVDPEEDVFRKELAALVERLLKQELTGLRQEKVIRMRFGFDNTQERTLEEIAQSMDRSRERIRQIETKSLRLMRTAVKHDAYQGLKDILSERWRRES